MTSHSVTTGARRLAAYWPGAAAAAICLGLAVAGCGSSSASSSSSASASASASPTAVSGTADVAYAGSLAYLNEKLFGPAFTKATGYAYTGRGAGSDQLASEITSGLITPNVFESVGKDPILSLTPRFTSWYVRYASTSMVVAYNPASKYASQFAAIASGKQPLSSLFPLMARSGFKLGRTDPNLDPQGRYFIYMLELAQAKYNLPANIVTQILGGPAASSTSTQIYSETALDSTMQSGQLDAASAFLSQAIQLHLHYISLPADINLGDYTLDTTYAKASIKLANGTVNTGKPIVLDVAVIGGKDQAAADKFVEYLLSAAGRNLYTQGGFTVLTPTAFGDTKAIPAAITNELGG